jgi:hypothetical protein
VQDRTGWRVWRVWRWDPPPPGLPVVLAREPDRIIRHEPIPLDGVREARTVPPWLNVAGLLWRRA